MQLCELLKVSFWKFLAIMKDFRVTRKSKKLKVSQIGDCIKHFEGPKVPRSRTRASF